MKIKSYHIWISVMYMLIAPVQHLYANDTSKPRRLVEFFKESAFESRWEDKIIKVSEFDKIYTIKPPIGFESIKINGNYEVELGFEGEAKTFVYRTSLASLDNTYKKVHAKVNSVKVITPSIESGPDGVFLYSHSRFNGERLDILPDAIPTSMPFKEVQSVEVRGDYMGKLVGGNNKEAEVRHTIFESSEPIFSDLGSVELENTTKNDDIVLYAYTGPNYSGDEVIIDGTSELDKKITSFGTTEASSIKSIYLSRGYQADLGNQIIRQSMPVIDEAASAIKVSKMLQEKGLYLYTEPMFGGDEFFYKEQEDAFVKKTDLDKIIGKKFHSFRLVGASEYQLNEGEKDKQTIMGDFYYAMNKPEYVNHIYPSDTTLYEPIELKSISIPKNKFNRKPNEAIQGVSFFDSTQYDIEKSNLTGKLYTEGDFDVVKGLEISPEDIVSIRIVGPYKVTLYEFEGGGGRSIELDRSTSILAPIITEMGKQIGSFKIERK